MEGSVHRSSQRSSQVAFRLSPDDHAELRRRARAAGVSIQAYLEWKALDRDEPRDRRSGPITNKQDRLPLTG